jgi:serine/threonine protein kinase
VPSSPASTASIAGHFHGEIDILMRLNDAHILSLFDRIAGDTNFILILEFCLDGQINHIIRTQSKHCPAGPSDAPCPVTLPREARRLRDVLFRRPRWRPGSAYQGVRWVVSRLSGFSTANPLGLVKRSELRRIITDGITRFPETTQPDIRALLKGMLALGPGRRATSQELPSDLVFERQVRRLHAAADDGTIADAFATQSPGPMHEPMGVSTLAVTAIARDRVTNSAARRFRVETYHTDCASHSEIEKGVLAGSGRPDKCHDFSKTFVAQKFLAHRASHHQEWQPARNS